MNGLGPDALAWVALSLALAGVVKGVTGIGIPLVGISLLSLVLSVPQAVALLPVPIIVANTWQSLAGGYFVHTCRRFALLLAAMTVGTVVGGAMLSTVDQPLLMVVTGSAVLIYASFELARVRIRVPPRHETAIGTAAGLLGGVLGGMSSIFGPPITLFLAALHMRKEEFVGTISTIYLAAGLVLGATLAGYRVAGPEELLWSALATVPLLAGLVVGQRTRRRVSETLFRKVLLVMLLLIGAGLVRRGLFA